MIAGRPGRIRAARDREERRCRSGEADVQGEVSEPQVKHRAAGPVNDEREQDDAQDDGHQPEEEHDKAGNGIPGDFSRSSHGLRLPRPARLIRTVGLLFAQSASSNLSPGPADGPPHSGGPVAGPVVAEVTAYAEARPESRASTSPANAVPHPIDATNQPLSR